MDKVLAERPAHVPATRVVDFDIYNPPGDGRDFHAAWKTLHAAGVPDLVWTPHNGGHWIATRFKIINQVAADQGRFANRVNIVPKASGEKLRFIPANSDPPEHASYRMLFNSSFSPKSIRGLEDRIRGLAIKLIESFRKDGRCNFTTVYAEVFPIQIFLSMMELPNEDAPMLLRCAHKMFGATATETSVADSIQTLSNYLRPWVELRLGKGGNDLHSRLINGRINGRSLTTQEAAQVSLTALLGGLDTVSVSLGFFMLFLARNPSYRSELTANESTIPAAVEELFRRFPIAIMAREVKSDIDYDGVEMKQGEMVLWPAPLANLDDRVNERPMDIDFHRTFSEYVTFGAGAHKCVGQHLARTEMRITIEEWLKRIPEFAIEPGYEITCSGGCAASVASLPLVWDVASTRDYPLDEKKADLQVISAL
jgi:camphor 5-monooxygenase